MARARNANTIGIVWGLLWGTIAGVSLRQIGLLAIVVGVLVAIVIGVAMRFAYAHGNRYRD